jgi:hypothetical protein
VAVDNSTVGMCIEEAGFEQLILVVVDVQFLFRVDLI